MQIKFNPFFSFKFLVSFSHQEDPFRMWRQKHLRTGPRPRRVQQSSRTGCLRCWCWCWFKGGLKRSAMFTFDTFVLRITHRKPLKGSEKLSMDVRTVFKSADLQNFVHSGPNYLKRNSFNTLFFIAYTDGGIVWFSFCGITLLLTHQFNSPAFVVLVISAFQNSWVSLTILMAKSCKNRFDSQ